MMKFQFAGPGVVTVECQDVPRTGLFRGTKQMQFPPVPFWIDVPRGGETF